jgi:hypothetical protein
MKSFLLACVAAVGIALCSWAVLSAVQQPAESYTGTGVRLGPTPL